MPVSIPHDASTGLRWVLVEFTVSGETWTHFRNVGALGWGFILDSRCWLIDTATRQCVHGAVLAVCACLAQHIRGGGGLEFSSVFFVQYVMTRAKVPPQRADKLQSTNQLGGDMALLAADREIASRQSRALKPGLCTLQVTYTHRCWSSPQLPTPVLSSTVADGVGTTPVRPSRPPIRGPALMEDGATANQWPRRHVMLGPLVLYRALDLVQFLSDARKWIE